MEQINHAKETKEEEQEEEEGLVDFYTLTFALDTAFVL